MSQTLSVEQCGTRLDKWLTSKFPYSRNFFHHIIERWWVIKKTQKWDTQVLKKSYKVRQWDKIIIDDLQRFLDGGILEEAVWIPIPIVEETDDYVVINKPKWVLSHPNSIRDVQNPSVVAWAYHHFKETLPSMWNFVRAGLVHRLDKETDGLMIIAKTEEWMSHFKSLFQAKSEAKSVEEKEAIPLKKCYKATCVVSEGWKSFLDKIKDSLPHYIIQDVIPKVPHPVVREWITKILSYKIEWLVAHISVEILTWRTHQIRYHLSSFWLPIVGDYLYNPSYQESDDKLQLTSQSLEFSDNKKVDKNLKI